MSVRAIEAEVSIKSGVQAECTIGREVIVEVHDDVNLESLSVTANGQYEPSQGVDGWDRVTVAVPERQPVTEPLSVTANGQYTPAEGVDGFSDVTVQVSERIPDIEGLTVTTNGTYTSSKDGYNPVTVAVPERVPITESLSVTENGNYQTPAGVDGYNSVTVSVPERMPVTESLSVTENGLYEPTEGTDGYNRVTVAVPPTIPDIEPLTITENGTYTAEGDGYNPVTVNVQGYKIHTVTVEIGENTVSNALALYDYFLPYFEGAVALLGIVMQESTYTVNNQFVSYLYGVDTGYEHRAVRCRGNDAGNKFTWRANNYDTYLVAGTHYTVTFVR